MALARASLRVVGKTHHGLSEFTGVSPFANVMLRVNLLTVVTKTVSPQNNCDGNSAERGAALAECARRWGHIRVDIWLQSPQIPLGRKRDQHGKLRISM